MASVRSYARVRPCEFCDMLFSPRMDLTIQGKGRFCSLICANKSRRSPAVSDATAVIAKYEAGKTIQQIANDLNLPWRRVRDAVKSAGIMRRSGQRLTGGYLTTYAPDGRRTYEHTVVAEAKIGRRLKPGEVVHHIDGNRLNNLPENLAVVSKRQHGLLHQQLEKLALKLVRQGMIQYQDGGGYIFSSELARYSKYA